MSLINQTTSYTTPGTHTYVVPQGVGSLEFHLWGAGGGVGGHGPTSNIQTGTNVVRVETGAVQVQTGTVQVQTGTQLVQTGTVQVAVGTHREAYQVSVASNNKGGNSKGGNSKGGVSYSTVTQYRTVIDYITEPVYTVQPVYVDQPTYTPNIVYTNVDTPIYSATSGGNGANGGGGGYSSRKIQVQYGDVIVISVGSSATNSIGGTSLLSPTNFNGGSGGVASNGARGGGGGAATVITVNGVIVAVAAGGGGGGGGGINNQSATAGTAATISGIGSGTQGSGISSVTGPATGGGGGAGFYSGKAGTSGTSGKGAEGGVCFGTIIQGGSGIIPGGISLPQYPGNNIGYATYSGAAILIFNKSFNINIKRDGRWNIVNNAWVKVNGDWKGIANGWTKVSGVWEPLISPAAVTGADNLITPAITYTLTADALSIAENDSVTFTLATTGIAAGTYIPYTATGISSYDLDAGALSGNFVVGTTDAITFTPKLNHVTNGIRTLLVSIDNTSVTETCTISDTSTTPLYVINGNVASLNEGEAVRFTLTSANGISGESINYEVTGISSSRLTSGSLTGTFVFGSAVTADFAISNDYSSSGTTIMQITLIGKGSSTTCAIFDTSMTPSGSVLGTTSGTTWTVPAGVYSASVVAIAGGGGGGGCDSHAGYNGYAGDAITGTISVTPGQVYTLYAGTGGAGGTSDQGGAPGGAGGTGYASGGNGSAAGPTPYSGGGGGGGAASVLVLASTPVLVAGGGAGGGGGGHGSTGQPQQGNYASGPAGGNGTAKGGDGGGAGGGGSGYPLGGGGGAVRSGDSGGYSGNNGQRVVPAGCAVASANNGGGAAVRNSVAAQPGRSGSIIVSWG